MSIVSKSVHESIGHDRIGEDSGPIGDSPVTG